MLRIAPSVLALSACFWLFLATPSATAVTGDISFESCLASEAALSGVEGCSDLTATTDQVRGLRSVVVTADGAHVYAATSHTVNHFVRTPVTGELAFADCITTSSSTFGCDDLSGTTTALRGASSLRLSPDGRDLYVVAPLEDAITQLSIGVDGALAFGGCWSSGSTPGCTDIGSSTAALMAVESVVVSTDGRFVYTTTPSPPHGNVALFDRGDSGTLSFAGCWSSSAVLGCTNLAAFTNALDEAGPMVLSPEGADLYLGSEGRDALVHLARDISTGSLSFAGCWKASGSATTGCTELATTALRSVLHEGVAISPDGTSVYTASNAVRAIAHFRRAADGSLSFGGCIASTGSATGCEVPFQTPAFTGVRSLAVSPDGLSLYGAALAGSALVHLRLDAAGAPTFGGCLVDNSAAANCTDLRPVTVDALESAEGVAVSPDGTSVYAVGSNAIVHARRETDLCIPSATVMCLNGRQFRVTVDWRDGDGNVGMGQVIDFGSVDSGLFWFFDPDNFEILVKVLDGCTINDRFWVFAAATTDVEYTMRVTDVLSGESRSYFNPLGNASEVITDTDAFASCGGAALPGGTRATESIRLDALQDHPNVVGQSSSWDLAALDRPSSDGIRGTCEESATALCLTGERFRVEVDWRDFVGATGQARVFPFGSTSSGLLWFFTSNNIELLVKVLDGCGLNDRFWVFAAATTTVEYSLKVTDTLTGEVMEYFNPLGIASAAITDTNAFATCP